MEYKSSHRWIFNDSRDLYDMFRTVRSIPRRSFHTGPIFLLPILREHSSGLLFPTCMFPTRAYAHKHTALMTIALAVLWVEHSWGGGIKSYFNSASIWLRSALSPSIITHGTRIWVMGPILDGCPGELGSLLFLVLVPQLPFLLPEAFHHFHPRSVVGALTRNHNMERFEFVFAHSAHKRTNS